MPAARDDYLLRMITQAAAALRRVREKLLGGAPADEVVHDAGAAIGELLGPQRTMLELLDARSAAALLGDGERVRLWASLLRVQSNAEESLGNTDRSRRLAARADALEQQSAATAS